MLCCLWFLGSSLWLCFMYNGDILGDRSITVSSHGIFTCYSLSTTRHFKRCQGGFSVHCSMYKICYIVWELRNAYYPRARSRTRYGERLFTHALRWTQSCAELSMNIYDSIWRMKKTVILLAAAGCCELETSSAMENVAVFGYNLSSTQWPKEIMYIGQIVQYQISPWYTIMLVGVLRHFRHI